MKSFFPLFFAINIFLLEQVKFRYVNHLLCWLERLTPLSIYTQWWWLVCSLPTRRCSSFNCSLMESFVQNIKHLTWISELGNYLTRIEKFTRWTQKRTRFQEKAICSASLSTFCVWCTGIMYLDTYRFSLGVHLTMHIRSKAWKSFCCFRHRKKFENWLETIMLKA